MKKTIKAWAIVDNKTDTLVRYRQDGCYMVEVSQIPQDHLHSSFRCVPIIITYELPTKKKVSAREPD